jgi:catechol 2,3-dioxygenase-like lactoylglutathione lyase family enzyme
MATHEAGMLTHVRLLADDLAADVAFYRDVVGLRQVVDVPGVYAEFDAGAVRLAFYRRDLMEGVVPGAPLRGHGACVLCLRVPSVDAEAARLAAAGILLVRPPHDQAAWHQRVAHVRDASGRLVELWSPLRSAQGGER